MLAKLKSNQNIIKILLVDDDDNDCLLFQNKINKLLNASSYRVDIINSYDDALPVIAMETHNIYFIDYSLGVKNGMDLIAHSISNNNHGPFVLLTGMDRPDLYQKSSKSGVFDYLLKDEITPSILERTITYTIENNNIRSELILEKNLVQNIIDEAPYLFMRVDMSGLIMTTNSAFHKITLYSDNDSIDLNWHDIIFAADAEKMHRAMIEKDETTFKTNIVCKDKTLKIIQWNILHNASDSNVLSIIGKDITSETEQEEQQRQHDKLQALGHLAGGVAHEINNLLQPIILNAEWISNSNPTHSTLDAVNDIISSARVASSIVEDILIFARQDVQNLDVLNFINTFDEALNIVGDMTQNGITITVTNSIDDENLLCLFALKDLVRVLSNLVLNASHAMKNSGNIDINLSRNDTDIKIDVVDTGNGIPTSQKEQIFNPFFTTKDIGEGTGLGLTMVYNLVKNWNGSIKFKSVEDEGTCFTIEIPIANF